MPDSLPDYFHLSYLRTGTARQRQTFKILDTASVFDVLRVYSPCLVGTIPLDVDIPKSDADIICYVSNHKAFRREIQRLFGHYPDFSVWTSQKQGLQATIGSFSLQSKDVSALRVEIFGQTLPVGQQNAYRHLVVEARLLALAGNHAKSSIRVLKLQGIKTEPAFAQYFDIEGEPYQALAALFEQPDEVLINIVKNCQQKCQPFHTV
jgi:hypothetical protein